MSRVGKVFIDANVINFAGVYEKKMYSIGWVNCMDRSIYIRRY